MLKLTRIGRASGAFDLVEPVGASTTKYGDISIVGIGVKEPYINLYLARVPYIVAGSHERSMPGHYVYIRPDELLSTRCPMSLQETQC